MKRPLTLTLSLLLSACAAQKIVAKNADFILERQLIKRIPLYSNQKTVLNRDIRRFLNSKKTQVKLAIPLLNQVHLQPNSLNKIYPDLSSIYQKIALDFSSLICDHLVELDEKQQKDFFRIIDKENKDLEKIKSSDQLEKIEDSFEDLTGDISKEQKKIFRSYLDYFENRKALRIKIRKRLATRIGEIFSLKVTKKEKENYLLDAFKEYQQYSFQGIKYDEIIAKILPTLTQEQINKLKKKTQDLKTILGYYLETDY